MSSCLNHRIGRFHRVHRFKSVLSVSSSSSVIQTSKARMLHAHYSPGIDYNNLAICNAVGVFKNGKGLFDDEDSLLNSLSGSPIKENHAIRLSDEFNLYPNPTDNELKLQYYFQDRKPRIFLVYDILGRQVLKQDLNPLKPELVLNTSSLQVGAYTYVIQQLNGQRFFGKIIIAR